MAEFRSGRIVCPPCNGDCLQGRECALSKQSYARVSDDAWIWLISVSGTAFWVWLAGVVFGWWA